MGFILSSYGLLAVFGCLAALAWAYIAVNFWWHAGARRRGGYWYLEAMLWYGIPISLLLGTLARLALGGTLSIVEDVAVLAVTALSAWALLQAAGNPRRGANGLVFAVLFFYGALLLSGLLGVVTSFPASYFTTPLVVLAFLLHGGYTYQWLLKGAAKALRAVVLLSFLAIAVMPPELVFNTVEDRTFFGIERLAGIAGHPNGLAALAVLGLFLELRAKSRWFWKVPFVVAILLAQSSTGYIVLAVGLLVMVFYARRVMLSFLGIAVVGFIAASLVVPRQVEAFMASIIPENAATFTGRTRIWEGAMHGFEVSPLVGYGPELLSEEYRAQYLPNAAVATHAFNQFIQSLAGSGLVGLASLVILMLAMGVYAFRARYSTGGLSLALVAFMVLRFVTETPLKPGGINVNTLTLAVVLALLVVAVSESRRSNRAGTHQSRRLYGKRAVVDHQPVLSASRAIK